MTVSNVGEHLGALQRLRELEAAPEGSPVEVEIDGLRKALEAYEAVAWPLLEELGCETLRPVPPTLIERHQGALSRMEPEHCHQLWRVLEHLHAYHYLADPDDGLEALVRAADVMDSNTLGEVKEIFRAAYLAS